MASKTKFKTFLLQGKLGEHWITLGEKKNLKDVKADLRKYNKVEEFSDLRILGKAILVDTSKSWWKLLLQKSDIVTTPSEDDQKTTDPIEEDGTATPAAPDPKNGLLFQLQQLLDFSPPETAPPPDATDFESFIRSDHLHCFVGKNSFFYRQTWRQIFQGRNSIEDILRRKYQLDGIRFSLNSGGLIFGVFWVMHRKMHVLATALFLTMFLVFLFLSYIFSGVGFFILSLLVIIGQNVLVGYTGNYFYFLHALGMVRQYPTCDALKKQGRTDLVASAAGAVIFFKVLALLMVAPYIFNSSFIGSYLSEIQIGNTKPGESEEKDEVKRKLFRTVHETKSRKLAKQLQKAGVYHYKRHNYKKAIEFFTKSLNADPTYLLVYGNRAWSHHESGESLLAIKDISELLRAVPHSVDSLKARALFYETAGKYHYALRDLSAASRLDPSGAAANKRAMRRITRKQKCHESCQKEIKKLCFDSGYSMSSSLSCDKEKKNKLKIRCMRKCTRNSAQRVQ